MIAMVPAQVHMLTGFRHQQSHTLLIHAWEDDHFFYTIQYESWIAIAQGKGRVWRISLLVESFHGVDDCALLTVFVSRSSRCNPEVHRSPCVR